ncbi:MAG: PKD domain-containing protein [Caldiserica bacterium]|nr:PKD domain-containing protein [Caldisericota bacterium]
MGARITCGLLGVILAGFALLAGPGLRQTLTFSSEGFSSLELVLFWTGEPASVSLRGRWEDTGLTYGGIGGSLRFEGLGLLAELGVEAAGSWETSLGGELSLPPLSLVGTVSFGIGGLAGWSLGALLAWDPLSLRATVTWEGRLRGDLAAYLVLEPLYLEASVSFSREGIQRVRGGTEIAGDLGTVGLKASFRPLTRELLLSTEFDLRSEHLSLGFAAVWEPFPGRGVGPAAVPPGGSPAGGILRYLRELRLEATVGAPAGEAAEAPWERPLALISAPGRSTFTVGEEIRFSARGSRSRAGPAMEFLWDFGDGGRARGIDVRHRYAAPGVYRVALTVRDVGGNSAVAERVLWIVPPGLSADFAWEPEEPTVLDEVRFIDLSRGDIVSWRWDFGDGTSSTERNPVHRYAAKGEFPVTLTVTDRYGNTAAVTKTVAVVNIPPVSDPGGPYRGLVLQEIVFDGTGSYDPDGRIVRYLWDFGDGSTAEGESVAHAYPEPGTYTVCLTAVDDDGARATSCTTAEVMYYPVPGGGVR